MNTKRKLELLAMLFATVHFVSDKIDADYAVRKSMHTIRILITKPGQRDNEYIINTNLSNLPEHIADVNAQINLLAK